MEEFKYKGITYYNPVVKITKETLKHFKTRIGCFTPSIGTATCVNLMCQNCLMCTNAEVNGDLKLKEEVVIAYFKSKGVVFLDNDKLFYSVRGNKLTAKMMKYSSI